MSNFTFRPKYLSDTDFDNLKSRFSCATKKEALEKSALYVLHKDKEFRIQAGQTERELEELTDKYHELLQSLAQQSTAQNVISKHLAQA